MNKAEIIAFLNANPECHLATLEGNKPRVRGMQICKADENGIILQTSTYKDLYKQLSANPNVELCFNKFGEDMGEDIQVRVSGAVEVVDDLELKKEIVAERQYLKPQVEKGGYEAIVVYRLKGFAHVWTIATDFDPKTYIQL